MHKRSLSPGSEKMKICLISGRENYKKLPKRNKTINSEKHFQQNNEKSVNNQHHHKSRLSSYNLRSPIQRHSRNSEHLFACIQGAPDAYKCNICNFTSDLKVNLIDHAVQVHNLPKMKYNMTLIMKKLECQNCNLQTYSFLLFKLHLCRLKRQPNIEKKEIGRNRNIKLFTKDSYFLRTHKFCKHRPPHVESHLDRQTDLFAYTCNSDVLDLYKCRICVFTTDLYVLLKNHLLKAHKAPILFNYNIESFTCNVCNFQTFSLLILYRHVCRNEKRKVEHNKWFYCTLCSHKSHEANYLKKHFRCKHPSAELLKCDRCKYTFVDRTHFERHLKWHSAIVRDRSTKCFYCEFCKYKAKQMSGLKQHILMNHEDVHKVKWFRCEHCDYKSKIKDNLKTHLRRIHSGRTDIHWHECKQCEFKSRNGMKLRNHSLEQHGKNIDMWFHCKYCEFKTARGTGIGQHMRKNHTDDEDIKLFQCELCELKLKTKESLKRHVWIKHIAGNDWQSTSQGNK